VPYLLISRLGLVRLKVEVYTIVTLLLSAGIAAAISAAKGKFLALLIEGFYIALWRISKWGAMPRATTAFLSIVLE
jgi:hypothetical protein